MQSASYVRTCTLLCAGETPTYFYACFLRLFWSGLARPPPQPKSSDAYGPWRSGGAQSPPAESAAHGDGCGVLPSRGGGTKETRGKRMKEGNRLRSGTGQSQKRKTCQPLMDDSTPTPRLRDTVGGLVRASIHPALAPHRHHREELPRARARLSESISICQHRLFPPGTGLLPRNVGSAHTPSRQPPSRMARHHAMRRCGEWRYGDMAICRCA